MYGAKPTIRYVDRYDIGIGDGRHQSVASVGPHVERLSKSTLSLPTIAIKDVYVAGNDDTVS